MVEDMIINMDEPYSIIFRKRSKAKNNAFSMFSFIESPKTVKIKIHC